eukprot:symbB.v1.2.018246.t1/scaffold1447.1/size118252/6
MAQHYINSLHETVGRPQSSGRTFSLDEVTEAELRVLQFFEEGGGDGAPSSSSDSESSSSKPRRGRPRKSKEDLKKSKSKKDLKRKRTVGAEELEGALFGSDSEELSGEESVDEEQAISADVWADLGEVNETALEDGYPVQHWEELTPEVLPGFEGFNRRATAVMMKSEVGQGQLQVTFDEKAACPPLQPHQEAVSFLMHPKSPIGRLLVDHPTGSGKTREMIKAVGVAPGSHAALTSDVTEPSNLHFPNSCYRPSLGTGVVPEDFVDWPSLKQKAWDFVDGPYEGGDSLKEICPAWWNATGCECECGNCSLLFSQCPVGFMLFRSLSLLCATKDPNIRLHELAIKKWGRGLLDLAKLRLGFADIIESGWPFFGILARIGDQLRLDGLSEEAAVGLLATRGAPTTRLGGSMAQGSTMCQQRGWRENNKYQEEVIQALEEDRPATLQASVDAGADKDACPLQPGKLRVFGAVLLPSYKY